MEPIKFLQENWMLIVIVIFILIMLNRSKIEGYSLATVQQITAVGPQDTHLTQDAWKYLPDKYYDGYQKAGKMKSFRDANLAAQKKANLGFNKLWNGEIPNICNTGKSYTYPYNYGY